MAATDLREVIAPRYFKAKVWGSELQTSAWIRITWGTGEVHIIGTIARASDSEGLGWDLRILISKKKKKADAVGPRSTL